MEQVAVGTEKSAGAPGMDGELGKESRETYMYLRSSAGWTRTAWAELRAREEAEAVPYRL